MKWKQEIEVETSEYICLVKRIDGVVTEKKLEEELIRCKDCKHYHEDSFREDEWVICRRTNLYTDGDKYCAWAERKPE